MNPKLLALLRNIMNELDELRHDVDRTDNIENECAVEYNIEREILLQALTTAWILVDGTKDGE